MNELDQFVGSIIDAKGYNDLDEETRGYMIEELKGKLIEQINRAILEEIPDEKVDELEKMIDSGEATPEKIQQFAIDCGVDVNAVTTSTLLYFRSFYLGGAA